MMLDEQNELDEIYSKAINFANSHYENFPVISFFNKKELRKYIAVIYQFARHADDIADEGTIGNEERLNSLNDYEQGLLKSFHSEFQNNFWKAVKDTTDKNKLTEQNFLDLLQAFKQDVNKNRYDNYDEVLDYCNYSANPVGRLILQLYNIYDETAHHLSDKICTALQLTNFYQDVSVDIRKNRIYIPLDELDIFQVNESDIEEKKLKENFIQLMKYQINRTRKLFQEGRELLKYLPQRLRMQILITIKGGEAILNKIEEINYNVINIRPSLSKFDFIKLFLSAIIFRR